MTVTWFLLITVIITREKRMRKREKKRTLKKILPLLVIFLLSGTFYLDIDV